MSPHWSPRASHSTFFTISATGLRERFLLSGVFYLPLLIPREAEDFPRGDKHFKHVPLLTYLIYLSPKELYVVNFFLSFMNAQICEESALHEI